MDCSLCARRKIIKLRLTHLSSLSLLLQDDDACTLSTQVPFFLRGTRFSSDAAWLAEIGEYECANVTPPRARRAPPAASTRPKAASSSSPRASDAGTTML